MNGGRLQRVAFLFVLTALGLGRAACGEPLIVKDGRPMAEIIVAEKPPRTTKLAAQELQTYVAKITGATLPIAAAPTPDVAVQLYVGRSPFTDQLKISDDGLKYGAFRLVSGKNYLVLLGHDSDFTPREPFHAGGPLNANSPALVEWDRLTGAKWGFPVPNLSRERSGLLGIWDKDDRGSFNAVTEFLRMQGVRWYLPDPLGEVVPQKASMELPKVDRTVRPDFTYRYPMQYGRMFGHPGTTRDEALWQLRLGLNNGAEPVGPQDVAIAHGGRIVHERAEMRDAHPEYFALYSGKRATEAMGGGQPCLSSPGLFEENVKFARAVFDIYDAPMVSVMPQDGYVNICQCPLCKGKDTPARGWTGQLSDYVWDYVNRVAIEVYKTHPNKKISCFAYGAYLLPPEKIEKLSPNLVVGICQNRGDFHDRKVREHFVQMREAWLKKTANPLLIGDYYLYARPNMPWAGVPAFYPHLVAEDLHSLKGISLGNFIEVYRDPQGIADLAATHLNLYVTSRLWWDADLDVNAMIEEYYTLFYGPAREEMKSYIEYCETNWWEMRKDAERIRTMFDLLAKAQEKAPADSVYAKRIALIANYVKPMKGLREQLLKGRTGVPKARGFWREKADLVMDGQLDDPFWQNLPWYSLAELQTGRTCAFPTTFKITWAGDSLYFGIRCEDREAPKVNVGATRNQDQAIWNGDCVEILLETQTHAYYQIAINPAGAMVSLDRKNGAINERWMANAEVATFIGNGFWSLEARIPVPGEQQEELDPLHGVSGKRPTETYPWYFNVCRQRVRDGQTEASAYSPTSKPSFHVTEKFAELYVR